MRIRNGACQAWPSKAPKSESLAAFHCFLCPHKHRRMFCKLLLTPSPAKWEVGPGLDWATGEFGWHFLRSHVRTHKQSSDAIDFQVLTYFGGYAKKVKRMLLQTSPVIAIPEPALPAVRLHWNTAGEPDPAPVLQARSPESTPCSAVPSIHTWKTGTGTE